MYRQNIYQCIFSNTGRVHFFFRYKGKQLFEGGEIYIINQSSWIGIHLKLLSLKGRGWSIKFIIIPILCLSLSFPKQVKTMQEKIKKTTNCQTRRNSNCWVFPEATNHKSENYHVISTDQWAVTCVIGFDWLFWRLAYQQKWRPSWLEWFRCLQLSFVVYFGSHWSNP